METIISAITYPISCEKRRRHCARITERPACGKKQSAAFSDERVFYRKWLAHHICHDYRSTFCNRPAALLLLFFPSKVERAQMVLMTKRKWWEGSRVGSVTVNTVCWFCIQLLLVWGLDVAVVVLTDRVHCRCFFLERKTLRTTHAGMNRPTADWMILEWKVCALACGL